MQSWPREGWLCKTQQHTLHIISSRPSSWWAVLFLNSLGSPACCLSSVKFPLCLLKTVLPWCNYWTDASTQPSGECFHSSLLYLKVLCRIKKQMVSCLQKKNGHMLPEAQSLSESPFVFYQPDNIHRTPSLWTPILVQSVHHYSWYLTLF